MPREIVALDFFTVPTATFRILFVLVVLSQDRRQILHFNVTEHPTSAWTARQLLEVCELVGWIFSPPRRFLESCRGLVE